MCGKNHSRIKRLEDEYGNEISNLIPGECGILVGLKGEYDVNDSVITCKSEKDAQKMVKEVTLRMQREEVDTKGQF